MKSLCLQNKCLVHFFVCSNTSLCYHESWAGQQPPFTRTPSALENLMKLGIQDKFNVRHFILEADVTLLSAPALTLVKLCDGAGFTTFVVGF